MRKIILCFFISYYFICYTNCWAQCIISDESHTQKINIIKNRTNKSTIADSWEKYLQANPRNATQKKWYTFKVSGNVIYQNTFANKEMNVYGVPIHLALKIKNSDKVVIPNFFWDDGYATTDMEGHFNIELNVYQDLSDFDKLIIGAMHEGLLVELDVEWQNYIIDYGYTPIKFEQGEGIQLPFSPEQLEYTYENTTLAVEPKYALTFSTITYAHRFVNRIYNYNRPFALPKVKIIQKTLNNLSGCYDPFSGNIFIDYSNNDWFLFYLLLHEFGHHLQHNMKSTLNFKSYFHESFANFFEYTCSNYIETIQPMYIESRSVWHHLDIYNGYNGSLGYPEYKKYTEFYIDLFDGKESHGFSPPFNIGDNESLEGGDPSDPNSLAHRLFNAFEEANSINKLLNHVKEGLEPAIQQQIDHYWEHLNIRDEVGYLDPDLVPPFPPQLRQVRGFKSEGGIYVTANRSDYFSLRSVEELDQLGEFDEGLKSKINKSINKPTLLRLEQFIDGSWKTFKFLNYKKEQHVSEADHDGIFRIGTLNDAGDAYGKLNLELEILQQKL